MKKLLLFTFALCTCQMIWSQNTVGTLLNTEASQNGYTLFSPRTTVNPGFTFLIDNCGEVVNSWESSLPLFSTDYLMPDGSLFRSVVDNQSTLNIPGNTGRIEHLDWDGNTIWALTYSDTDFSFHHDFVVLENGNIIMIVARRRTAAEAIENGRDPSTMNGPELYEEMIVEIEPVGTNDFNIVWEWFSWDHLIQDFDNTKANFGVVGENPQLIDINFEPLTGDADWWHSNALSYSAELDQLILSNRNLDEFIIIDHSTTTAEASGSAGGNSGMGGDIIYRWGNPESYRQGDETDQVFYAQHDVHFIPEGRPDAGKIMIFNNGPDIGFTQIQIIDAPYDETTQNYTYTGGAYGPASPEFSYSNPGNFFSGFLSGSQQLSNGNILICDGPGGIIFEIDADENEVWRYQSPVGNTQLLSDGDDPSTVQTRMFRSLRYTPDYEAFEGRDLTPMGVIEANPADDGCELLSIDDIAFEDSIEIYPTLVDDILQIDNYTNEPITVTIYSSLGIEIMSYNNPNEINLEGIATGLYLVAIANTTKTTTKKILKR